MKEQAGIGPVPAPQAAGAGTTPFGVWQQHGVSVDNGREAAADGVAAWVVPPLQRLAMPVQRLEPISLRRLLGAPERLQTARIAPAASASDDR